MRIAIIKKNKAALTSLIRDLEDINADSREIPTLIIDDEADQASVNTTNPKRSRKELADRTAINRKISELLKLLPRAQYLGYTATPFANVFVSPDDVADIFPKDFIISLEPSAEYMGGKQFHDLAPVASDPSGSGMSNEEAHVRALLAGGGADDDAAEREEMQEALDAFVLSGAIKLWRQEHVDGLSFRHHTMLVHESVKQAEHKDLADMVRDVWATSDFSGPGGLARLRELYLADFVKVHAARDWGAPLPADFDELLPHLGEALVEILADGDPVVIVNGSKDSDYDAMDFSRRPYWRIMVGGAKLSRGFTVEGLTVSYYRRRAMAADTLMQMGRWFGYRPGYRDLVRLYIGRDVIDGRGKSFDLYDAFTAILEDEEEFRDQLRAFAALDDEGRPVVLPRNVPPMVFSQLSWLKPTGTNRMYNAVLKMMARGGQLKDRFNMPAHGEKKHEHNLRLALKLIDVPGQRRELLQTKSDSIRFPARVSFRSAQEVLAVLKNMAWGSHIDPDIQFMLDAISRGTLNDFAIVLPELDDAKRRTVLEVDLPIIQRKRRAGRGDFSGSEPKHRGVIEYIAGNPETWTNPDIEEGAMIPDCRYDDNREPSLADDAGRRGAILINFAYESSDGRYLVKDLPDEVPPQDVVTLISIAMPYASAPRGRIAFQVRDAGHPDAVTVDV